MASAEKKFINVVRADGAVLELSAEEVRALQTLFYHTGGRPVGARGFVNDISRVLSDATGIHQWNHFEADGTIVFGDELPRARVNAFE